MNAKSSYETDYKELKVIGKGSFGKFLPYKGKK